MLEVLLERSDRKDKKFKVFIFSEGKTIHFGGKNYEDFTIHKDIDRKKRYIARHKKNEDWEDPLTAGFWSRWIGWNKPTIEESMLDIQKRFNIIFI